MGVWVRIVMWMLTGALLKAGLPPDIVNAISGDASLHLAIEQGILLVAAAVVGLVTAMWRRLALRFGWST